MSDTIKRSDLVAWLRSEIETIDRAWNEAYKRSASQIELVQLGSMTRAITNLTDRVEAGEKIGGSDDRP